MLLSALCLASSGLRWSPNTRNQHSALLQVHLCFSAATCLETEWTRRIWNEWKCWDDQQLKYSAQNARHVPNTRICKSKISVNRHVGLFQMSNVIDSQRCIRWKYKQELSFLFQKICRNIVHDCLDFIKRKHLCFCDRLIFELRWIWNCLFWTSAKMNVAQLDQMQHSSKTLRTYLDLKPCFRKLWWITPIKFTQTFTLMCWLQRSSNFLERSLSDSFAPLDRKSVV